MSASLAGKFLRLAVALTLAVAPALRAREVAQEAVSEALMSRRKVCWMEASACHRWHAGKI
jgi:hypothetical protein